MQDEVWYAEAPVQTARFVAQTRAARAPNPQSVLLPSLDGRIFRSIGSMNGDVDSHTRFCYHERDGMVWAEYGGGDVLRGHLVGTRSGNELHFRYVHLRVDAVTASGVCRSVIRLQKEGRVRLLETWRWESQDGRGTSVLEEDQDARGT